MKPHYKPMHVGAALLLVITSLVVAPAPPAHAFTIWSVDTLVDESDGSCGDGDCSLRDALALSAANDAISIGSGTIVLSLGQLVVAHNVTIGGNGMDETFIDADGASRVISISFGPGAVVLNDMTLTGGSTGSGGGGVENAGTLSLERIHITGNAAAYGGGILSTGPLNISDSLIDWNTAADSGGGYGGGAYLNGAVTTTLNGVTLGYNSAEGYSGGIHSQGGGTLNLNNVTLMGNSADQGAALTVTSSSTANFLNGTIAGNTAGVSNVAVAAYATATFKNTIISGNSPGNCLAGGGSTWTTLGNNMDSGTTCSFGAAGDQSSTDPQLAVMSDYGGAVPTMPLLGTSPAIDAGTNTGCPGTDARGFTRPVDGPGAGGNVCDMGAVEMKAETTIIGPYGIAPSPSTIGQDTTVSMIVTGSSTTPTGLVEISSGSLSCSPALDITGFANCGMNFGTPGGRGILYRYMGDGTHDASQAALYHIVNQASRTDFNNDGVADPARYIPGTGTLWWRTTFSGTWYSTYMGSDVAEYVRRSDFDGDGNTDPAKYVSSINSIYYLSSFGGTWQGIYMGTGSYTLLPGSDFDRDGFTDPAKYQTDGAVWRLLSDTATWAGTFIGTDAVPALPGSDYDGDGKTDVAKYVSAGAIWYQRSSDGVWDGMYIGSDGTPVPASDFDGDGTTDMAKFLSSSNSLWYRSSDTGMWQGVYLGPGTLEYIPGTDFDGDGKTDPAKFDTVGKALWWLKSSTGLWDGSYMGPETYSIVD